MIHILGVSGSPIKGGNTETFLGKALHHAESLGGVSTRMVSLAEMKVADCIHCNWCVTRQVEGRPCKQEDDMQQIYPLLFEADAILLATPVYVARLSGYMANFLDRLRALAHGNYYKDALEDKVGGALSVAWMRHGGLETALLSMVYSFMAFNMIPVGCDLLCVFGAAAVTSRGGVGEFDKNQKLGVLEDDFGLKTMESLVNRVVKLTKKIQRNHHE